MGFQIPLLVIDRRDVSVMSGVFPNRRIIRLRIDSEVIVIIGEIRENFGIVPEGCQKKFRGSKTFRKLFKYVLVFN